GRRARPAQRLREDALVRLLVADLVRDHEHLEELIEAELGERLRKPAIPVRDDAEPEPALSKVAKRLARARHDLPRIARHEALVEGLEDGADLLVPDLAAEGLGDDVEPLLAKDRVGATKAPGARAGDAPLPGLTKALVEGLRVDAHTVLRRHLGVDRSDGCLDPKERAADVEEDDLDGPERGGLFACFGGLL